MTLYDDLHDWTFNPPKGTSSGFLKHRLALRRARRFIFDEALSTSIDDLAETSGHKLKEWLQLARLPYQDVWLEFQHDGIRTGFLISGHPKRATRWLCHSFFYALDDEHDIFEERYYLKHRTVLPSTFSFVVDTEAVSGDDIRDALFAPVLSDAFPWLLPEHFEMVMWGLEEKYGYREIPKRGFRLEEPWFISNVYLSPEPAMGHKLLMSLKNNLDIHPESHHELYEVLLPAISSTWSYIKHVLVALAVMNDVPVDTDDIAPIQRRSSASHRGTNKGLGHSLISLRIPAKRPTAWLKRRLDGSVIRKRRHEVRGHWRTYRDRETGEVRKKVWIADHGRGDAGLGHVAHEYRLRNQHGGTRQ